MTPGRAQWQHEGGFSVDGSVPSASSATTRIPGGSGPLLLTPLELLDRLAGPVPPPRTHRHRYFGALERRALTGKLSGDPERQKLAVMESFP